MRPAYNTGIRSNLRAMERPVLKGLSWHRPSHGKNHERAGACGPTAPNVRGRAMLINSSYVNVAPFGTSDPKTAKPRQAAMLPSLDGCACSPEKHCEHSDTQAYRLRDQPLADKTNHC